MRCPRAWQLCVSGWMPDAGMMNGISYSWLRRIACTDWSCDTEVLGECIRQSAMSHVAWMNGTCHIWEWGMSRVWSGRVTHRCYGYVHSNVQWVMAHIWILHVMCMNEACHVYELVMSYIGAGRAVTSRCTGYYGRWRHVEWSVRSHIYIFIWVHIYIYIYICVNIHILVYICIYTYSCICVFMCIYVYMYDYGTLTTMGVGNTC